MSWSPKQHRVQNRKEIRQLAQNSASCHVTSHIRAEPSQGSHRRVPHHKQASSHPHDHPATLNSEPATSGRAATMLRYYTQPRTHLPNNGGRVTRVQPPPPPPQAPPTLSLSAIQTAFQRSTTLFLTRRLPPALETLHPVLPYTNKCVRSLRVKIWSTYFAILDAVLKLEGPEGKDAFGSLRSWREVKNRVRKAKIWEELLGTYGDVGRAEIEIVTACITLLVRHTQDYQGLQAKIESYLAAAGPAVDMKASQRRAREQLLEMYTLIVLPGVGDWAFARQFIEGNDDLGDISKAVCILAQVRVAMLTVSGNTGHSRPSTTGSRGGSSGTRTTKGRRGRSYRG